MPTNRDNSKNTQGTTQPKTNATGAVGANITVTSFPRPAGQTITLAALNGALSANGATVGDVLERDSDGGFWDPSATTPCNVPCDYTSLATGNDMLSN